MDIAGASASVHGFCHVSDAMSEDHAEEDALNLRSAGMATVSGRIRAVLDYLKNVLLRAEPICGLRRSRSAPDRVLRSSCRSEVPYRIEAEGIARPLRSRDSRIPTHDHRRLDMMTFVFQEDRRARRCCPHGDDAFRAANGQLHRRQVTVPCWSLMALSRRRLRLGVATANASGVCRTPAASPECGETRAKIEVAQKEASRRRSICTASLFSAQLQFGVAWCLRRYALAPRKQLAGPARLRRFVGGSRPAGIGGLLNNDIQRRPWAG